MIFSLDDVTNRMIFPPGKYWNDVVNTLVESSDTKDGVLDFATALNLIGFYDSLYLMNLPTLEKLSRHFRAKCAEKILVGVERVYPGVYDIAFLADQIRTLRDDSLSTKERNQLFCQPKKHRTPLDFVIYENTTAHSACYEALAWGFLFEEQEDQLAKIVKQFQ